MFFFFFNITLSADNSSEPKKTPGLPLLHFFTLVLKYGFSISLLAMANKLKSSKTKGTEPDQLKQEKEEKVEVKQLLKDERTHKITGSILLLLAFLFFIAFTSFLVTGGEDRDKLC